MQYILSILVSNHFGVLNRVTHLFSRRGYNVKELTVGETLNPDFSRITVITEGDEEILDQIHKQISKLYDVKKSKILPNNNSISRELVLIKLKNSQKTLLELNKYNCKILENSDCIIAEMTGDLNEASEFLNKMKKFDIIEISRTGITSLEKGMQNYLSI